MWKLLRVQFGRREGAAGSGVAATAPPFGIRIRWRRSIDGPSDRLTNDVWTHYSILSPISSCGVAVASQVPAAGRSKAGMRSQEKKPHVFDGELPQVSVSHRSLMLHACDGRRDESETDAHLT